MINFKLVNVNFNGKKTCDCVVRALTNASGKDYKVVAQELFDIYMKYGYDMADKHTTEKWFEANGFVKYKQPRKYDNRKYLVGEIDELINEGDRVVISCANHYTSVVDDVLTDLWDCRFKTIGNYWVLERKQ